MREPRAGENDEGRQGELDFACSEWRKSDQADAYRTEIERQLTSTTEQQRQCEASYAQSEILDFIRSGRREFTPLNLAAAMAGIPYLSARISSERVRSIKPKFTNGHAYLIFTAFRANFFEWPRHLEDAIERMRTYLIAVNRKKLPHIKELRKNWYFVALAIRKSVKEPRGTRGSLPYRIYAEYMTSSTSQRIGDSVLAETNRILIRGERPELEGLPNWSE